MILIEGLDGTGKTSLAKKISEITKWPIINIFDGEDYDFLKKLEIRIESYHEDLYFLDSWLRLGSPDCILDRGIISGVVYAKDKEERKKADIAMKYWFERAGFPKVYAVLLDIENEKITERDEDWKGREEELNWLRIAFYSVFFNLNYKRANANAKVFRGNDSGFREVLSWLKIRESGVLL